MSRPVADVRKTVTAVFCDVAESTALGRDLDPESLQRLMESYFAAVSEVLVRHGGTVEKYVGDAVMAVFGIPRAHEDDPLRACRAAVDMLAAVEQVDRQVARGRGVRLEVRIGVETGEVVVGDSSRGSTFASGLAVNAAARLEQAAAAGECLIGPQCYGMVRDQVQATEQPGLVLKGFAGQLTAYRLTAAAPADLPVIGGSTTAMVGRSREMGVLDQAFHRVTAEGSCQLVTVLADAGAGKSRLAAEFVAGLGQSATVLRGRCLPYGEGITYWPLVEAVRDAAGLSGTESEPQARKQLAALLGDDAEADEVVARVAPVAGLGGTPGTAEDTTWAVQRLLERLAAVRPVVLVVDDLHWARPGLRSVLDDVADWSRDAPILLLALARTDLLDDAPGWATDKSNSVTVRLDPLRDTEVAELVAALPGAGSLPAEIIARVEAAAGGNPLFAEHLTAMLVDMQAGDSDPLWPQAAYEGTASTLDVPLTISALLTARLDLLPAAERTVLGVASVAGLTFYRAAVVELADQSAESVLAALRALLRKGLLHAERTDLAGQDAIRFDHALVRDAAYHGLSKNLRADLHERFARWLEQHSRGQAYDELVGAHLEAAFRNLSDLGPVDERARRLGQEAADRLATAGRLLLGADDTAATTLLGRALDLSSEEGPSRWTVMAHLAFGLTRFVNAGRAEQVARDLRDRAEAAGDARWAAHGSLALALARHLTDPEGTASALRQAAEAAVLVFQREDDHLGLGIAHYGLGEAELTVGHVEASAFHGTLVSEHFARAGFAVLAATFSVENLNMTLMEGGQPATRILEAARRATETADGRWPRACAWLSVYACAQMLGHAEEASHALLQVGTVERQRPTAGGADPIGWANHVVARVETACGRGAAVVDRYDRECAALEESGDASHLSTQAALHGYTLLLAGDRGAARARIVQALELGSLDDLVTQGLARASLAWLEAANGAGSEQVRLHIAEATAAVSETEFVLDRAIVHLACSEASRLIGDIDETRRHRQEAINLYEAKENVVGAAFERARL
jgi:class 3 adenylate cyclase